MAAPEQEETGVKTEPIVEKMCEIVVKTSETDGKTNGMPSTRVDVAIESKTEPIVVKMFGIIEKLAEIELKTVGIEITARTEVVPV